MKRELLIVSIAFRPNVGGVETHLDDYAKALVDKDYTVHVLTYQPLETNIKAPFKEKTRNLLITRLPIFKGLFYRLVQKPALEFLFLTPLLFLATPVYLLAHPGIKVIHAHGIIAGIVAVFWAKISGKKVWISTHSIYSFPKTGLYRSLTTWMFTNADQIFTLSDQSKKEVIALGVSNTKVETFTYWVDQSIFKPINKSTAKEKISLKDCFIVLFVGRLISEKGIRPLLEAASSWNRSINLLIAGTGPLEDEIKKYESLENITFAGKVAQKDLPTYYNAADIVIVPSLNEEGFGRVIIEALSCGTPVVGADKGGIPEAINEDVGQLIDVSSLNIKAAIEYLFLHKETLEKKSKAALEFAKSKYNKKNIDVIIKHYQ